MASKLALLACTETREGPWTRTQGRETGFRVAGVGEGDLVFIDYELRGFTKHASYEVGEGQHPFHHADAVRFRVRKIVEDKATTQPTTVTVDFP